MPVAELTNPDAGIARRRGEILRQLGLMEERDEHEFDDLVELAAAICGKPIGAMTLQDEETQLLKARIGLQGGRTMPVRESVCQHTIRGSELFEVEDLSVDGRFLSSINFQRETDVRFYAGMPLTTLDGTPVGALCVMDTRPAQLSPLQRRALEILGRQASDQIQLRERARAIADMVEERERGREMFSTILNNVPVEIYLKDSEGRIRFYNRKLAQRFAISDTEWLNKTSYDLWDEGDCEGHCSRGRVRPSPWQGARKLRGTGRKERSPQLLEEHQGTVPQYEWRDSAGLLLHGYYRADGT